MSERARTTRAPQGSGRASRASGYGLLHPAVRQHLQSLLGRGSLDPVQAQAVEPVLDGEDVLVGAPFSGGRREAAAYPVFSRMLGEAWEGTSVICVGARALDPWCVWLDRFARRIGRRAERLTSSAAPEIAPGGQGTDALDPDVLVLDATSLERLLDDVAPVLEGVRVVVLDDVERWRTAPSGGLLADALDALELLVDRRVQRIGLTDTEAASREALYWLSPGDREARIVAAPPDPAVP